MGKATTPRRSVDTGSSPVNEKTFSVFDLYIENFFFTR